MRQAAKRGLLTVMATGSVLASTAGYAYATADAQGAAIGSPGVGSGNTVQVPVDIPINICGNTIDVVGLLNPAIGNTCVNASEQRSEAHGVGADAGHEVGDGHGEAGHSRGGGATAEGSSNGSPGVLSGNTVQVPVHVPINACGNSIDVIGLGNIAAGNDCANVETPAPHVTPPVHHPSKPPVHHRPPTHHRPTPVHHESPHPTAPSGGSTAVVHHAPELASTGAGDVALAGTVAAGMILGGAVLYRRGRVGSR
ncbi:chaplin [Streptomyces sp. NPDC092296]|uniref:chaplin n=1 Tax=Streptomyces sp. NPDC092296 TaxID=3366012 RepID=UPI0038162D2D